MCIRDRVLYDGREGKEYKRIRRHPNELCKMSIDLMVGMRVYMFNTWWCIFVFACAHVFAMHVLPKVNHHTPASQVPGIIETCWKPLGIPTHDLELGSRQVHNNYRPENDSVDFTSTGRSYIYLYYYSLPVCARVITHNVYTTDWVGAD